MYARIVSVFLCLLVFINSAAAQGTPDANSDFPQVVLEKARELSDLHRSGTPSFRLEASFETYDYKGQPDGKGSLTEAYLREGFWQRSIRYRDKRSVITSVNGKLAGVSDPDYQSTFPLGHVIADLFEPIPSQERLNRYTFKTTTLQVGGTKLSCVIGSLPYRAAAPSTDLDFHPGVIIARHDVVEQTGTAPNEVYCVDKDPAIVRIVEGHNGVTFAFNRIIRFGSVYVPGDITMMEKGKMRAHLHVDGIMAVPELTEKDIVLPPGDSREAEELSEAAKTAVPPRILHKVDPFYPPDAKQRHVQGTVVLHGLIAKDGHVRDLELVSAPDDALVDSAMSAVRNWVYSPYLVNGLAHEVDTQITVNYALR